MTLSGTITPGSNVNSRIAWQTSIRVLRQLCNGTLPKDVDETLLFLLLARAMGLISHTDTCTQSSCNCSYDMFSEDLQRWQRLFQDNQVDLERFREAAKELWGINMSRDITPQMPSEELLNQFQEIVFRILDRTEKALQLVDGKGDDLLTVQSRWRASTVIGADPAFEDGQQSSSNIDNGFDLKSPGHCHSENDWHSNSPEAEQRKRNKMSNRSLWESQLFVFLIAGAIFAAVLSFILALRKSLSQCDTKMTDHIVHSYQVRTQGVMEVVTHSLRLAVQNLSALWSVSLSSTFEVVNGRLKQVIDHHNLAGLEHIKGVLSSEDGKHFGDFSLMLETLEFLDRLWPTCSLRFNLCFLGTLLGLEGTLPTMMEALVFEAGKVVQRPLVSPELSSQIPSVHGATDADSIDSFRHVPRMIADKAMLLIPVALLSLCC
ncbi:hypothetical protein K469DRAFT_721238 [Zopfia rhizophila CBS 207.26]|uniref:Uncharacterized protein n=1 Tax=Zopfia rhizophila CBS 207.26 TaxID=1314779 RepID=A0A6A6EFU2_9PEZI|nr:hypothetical protein K469DRAFT_721238 [Zopfia rhizophila CBS 207.26]